MKASISYYPNLQKKSKKTGSIPCYVRVILNGSKAEERLAIQFSTHEMQKWDPMTMRLRDRTSTNNFVLNNLDQKFQEFLIPNSTRLSLFTPRMILDHIMGKNHEQNITVLEFVDSVFEKSIKNNGSLSPGTVRNYKKAINHLKAFLLHCKTEKLLLCQVNADFSREFMDYLLSTVPKYSKKNSAEKELTGCVLPHRSNKELNVQLKIIAALCNIPFNLTSHVARHTFRQLLAEAGIEDIAVIKRMMGQSRGDEIDEIYYSVTESRLLAAKEKFETYLKKHLIHGESVATINR